MHRNRDRLGDRLVAGGDVVQRPMRFDMLHARVERQADGLKCGNLPRYRRMDFLQADVEFAAPETCTILVGRMRTDGDAMALAEGDGFHHRRRIACVSTAGDARRTHQRHDGRVVAASFAQIAIEIELRHGAAWGQGVGAGAGSPAGVAAAAFDDCVAVDVVPVVDALAGVHNFASGFPPSICARTSGIGGPP